MVTLEVLPALGLSLSHHLLGPFLQLSPREPKYFLFGWHLHVTPVLPSLLLATGKTPFYPSPILFLFALHPQYTLLHPLFLCFPRNAGIPPQFKYVGPHPDKNRTLVTLLAPASQALECAGSDFLSSTALCGFVPFPGRSQRKQHKVAKVAVATFPALQETEGLKPSHASRK